MWAYMLGVLVVRIVEKWSYCGNMAGLSGLKNPLSRGIINAGIGLRMLEWHYRFLRMIDLTTTGAGMKIGQNQGIAKKGVEGENKS